ncbi:MAG: 3-methyl-2-oxobutanoate hydroxymethyltransferase [Myxococcota bacterium]|nr:3-methyl-2-oxobutanoate hydroxymethyltransferase [Myxococcota bacterium]
MPQKALTTVQIRKRKNQQSKLVMATAYDATFSRLLEMTQIDILLVGDSLGMVIQGHDTTIPVTLDHIIYHTQAVVRGAPSTHIVADMPFMSYRVSKEQGLENATRLIQEGGAHAVKLEGGEDIAESASAIVKAGIPVMGHIGLTPQSVHAMGGFRVQGKTQEAATRLKQDAKALEEAGCYSLVLEGIPSNLAKVITDEISIPTVGIGAGVGCDGQVLVCYDFLGLNLTFKPKFLKRYATLEDTILAATRAYIQEVRNGTFPSLEHSFKDNNLHVVSQEETEPAFKLYGQVK